MRLRTIHLKTEYVVRNPHCLSASYFNALAQNLNPMPIGMTVTPGEIPGHSYVVELTYVEDLPEDTVVVHAYGSYPH